ncbi:DUF1570 domain-containing protein [Pseudoalteromonas galatheae]|uniref:DUF1570 domain-containing protein n=1 Tax=Pseudoalteromonas galatheae TaxID=579562 RepID=UPI0030CE0670
MKGAWSEWKEAIFKACLVVFSVLLFLFFDGREFWFTQIQPQLTNMLSNQKTELNSAPVVSEQKFKQPSSVQSTNGDTFDHQTSLRQFGRCVSQQAEGIKYRVENGIYTWVDERGITNYSDKKPSSAAKHYQPERNRALDFFDLNISGPNITEKFKNTLSAKLNAVFRGYTSIVGLDAMQKVTLRIKVLPNRREYERVVKSYGGNPKGNVGLYLGRYNLALVEQRNHHATMQTAVHEAVHAINQAVIGYTPRWLNEGLAGYFQTVKVMMQIGTVAPNQARLHRGYIKGRVLSPYELINAESKWKSYNSELMYKSSWATIHFMMSTTNGRLSLKKLMLQEQTERCRALSNRESQALLRAHYPNIVDRFASFIQSPVEPQRL